MYRFVGALIHIYTSHRLAPTLPIETSEKNRPIEISRHTHIDPVSMVIQVVVLNSTTIH